MLIHKTSLSRVWRAEPQTKVRNQHTVDWNIFLSNVAHVHALPDSTIPSILCQNRCAKKTSKSEFATEFRVPDHNKPFLCGKVDPTVPSIFGEFSCKTNYTKSEFAISIRFFEERSTFLYHTLFNASVDATASLLDRFRVKKHAPVDAEAENGISNGISNGIWYGGRSVD